MLFCDLKIENLFLFKVVLALEGGYMGPRVGEAAVECVRSLLGETCRQVRNSLMHFLRDVWIRTQRAAVQRYNTDNSKQIFLGKELRGYSPNSYIHVSVSDLYIPLIGLTILLQDR